MIGASVFSLVSPVMIPTFSGSKCRPNSTHLELDSAFSGEAYQARPPFSSTDKMASRAIHVFPEPVGAMTRQSVFLIASNAFIWKSSGTKGVGCGFPIWAKTLFRDD